MSVNYCLRELARKVYNSTQGVVKSKIVNTLIRNIVAIINSFEIKAAGVMFKISRVICRTLLGCSISYRSTDSERLVLSNEFGVKRIKS